MRILINPRKKRLAKQPFPKVLLRISTTGTVIEEIPTR